MKACRCGRPSARLGRAGGLGCCLASGLTLFLLPKCPACVAAYVMLATGIGITLPMAACFRWILMLLCGGTVIFVLVWRIRSVRTWH